MCGIACYFGGKRKASFLMDALSKLQYRGYDSAGLASLNGGRFEVFKQIGEIAKLSKKLPDDMLLSCALSHTRWATNGEVSKLNCHPHLSNGGVWAVVHNGIIENYKQLKSELLNPPKSQTDTAVVAEMLEEKNVQNISDFIDVMNVCEGSFALVATTNQEKNMFLAKRKSPLFVAENDAHEFLSASDPICFLGFAESFYCLDDDEFAEIVSGKITFFDKNAKIVKKDKKSLNIYNQEISKRNYSSFMLKEILEEGEVLEKQVEYYQNMNILERFSKEFFDRFDEILFIGCGTAYHASLVGAKIMSKLAGFKARAEIASEFVYNKPHQISNKTLVILVSQSGETADTLKAMEIAKSYGAFCVALTNVPYSALSAHSDIVLPVCAGVEVAVASTKAYVCQITAIYMLAQNLANCVNSHKVDYFSNVLRLSKNLFQFSQGLLDELAEVLAKENECIMIGKDLDYVTALEASLKLKETAYIKASAYPSGELKHGYLALVANGTPLLVFAFNSKINQKSYNSAEEARSRGARVFIFTNDKSLKGKKDVLYIDFNDEILSAVASIVPLQLLACKVCDLKNICPDNPKNLAKSVTVE